MFCLLTLNKWYCIDNMWITSLQQSSQCSFPLNQSNQLWNHMSLRDWITIQHWLTIDLPTMFNVKSNRLRKINHSHHRWLTSITQAIVYRSTPILPQPCDHLWPAMRLRRLGGFSWSVPQKDWWTEATPGSVGDWGLGNQENPDPSWYLLGLFSNDPEMTTQTLCFPINHKLMLFTTYLIKWYFAIFMGTLNVSVRKSGKWSCILRFQKYPIFSQTHMGLLKHPASPNPLANQT